MKVKLLRKIRKRFIIIPKNVNGNRWDEYSYYQICDKKGKKLFTVNRWSLIEILCKRILGRQKYYYLLDQNFQRKDRRKYNNFIKKHSL
jgi:hypothetical protein